MNKFTASIFVIIIFCLNLGLLYAQREYNVTMDALLNSNPPVEEVSMQITAENIGFIQITCFVGEKKVYVPVKELFALFQINQKLRYHNSYATGFFIDENRRYSISVVSGISECGQKRILNKRVDFYVTENDLFINLDIFHKLFGIDFTFESKQMRIFMSSEEKLPIVLETERKLLRDKLLSEGFLNKADFFLPRKRKTFGLGFLDWKIAYGLNNPGNTSLNYNFSLGSEIAGGDFSGSFSGSKDEPPDWENTSWRWRYVTENKMFRQAIAGDIILNSGLLYNTNGFQLTNAPPNTRATASSYKISDVTFPNWEVELYINNQLLAYKKASATGYFEFNLPLFYGSNFITMKFYGPSGEVRYSNKVVQVPYSFLPKGIVEYSLSGGALKYGRYSKFAEGNIGMGMTSFFTVGTGLTYLNYPGVKNSYPNVNASLKITGNYILSSALFPDLKNRYSLNILYSSLISSEISYQKYSDNAFFNPSGTKEEKSANLYLPLNLGDVYTSLRLSMTELTFSNFKLRSVNTGFFINYDKLQGIIFVNGIWRKTNENFQKTYLRTNLTLAYRLLGDLLLRYQTEIDHVENRVINAGFAIEKGILRMGWLSAFISNDFTSNHLFGGISFRLDLTSARVSTDYSANRGGWSLTQSAYGSIGYDDFKKKFITNNQFMVNRGAISIVPFVDGNNNDKLDAGERVLDSQLETRMQSGTLVTSADYKNYWYIDLDPYKTYMLEVNPVTFENPLYRPKYKNIAVTIDPNRFKAVTIPIVITGIISGRVSINSGTENTGANRFKVVIASTDRKFKTEAYTFSDGEYIFENLPPGNYKIYIEDEVLSRNNLTAEIKEKRVYLKPSEEGEIMEGIDFVLTPR